MKPSTFSTMSLVLLVACGGGAKPKPAAPRPTAPAPVARPVEPAPEPAAPPPPPPMEWRASAQLAPLKGVKMAVVNVVFLQTEGESTSARSSTALDQLKAGSYHLAIHQGGECGPRATKIGALLVDLSAGALLVATKHAAPSIETNSVAIALDGDASIIGHTLVLHADKRGKPGKPVACGVVVSN